MSKTIDLGEMELMLTDPALLIKELLQAWITTVAERDRVVTAMRDIQAKVHDLKVGVEEAQKEDEQIRTMARQQAQALANVRTLIKRAENSAAINYPELVEQIKAVM